MSLFGYVVSEEIKFIISSLLQLLIGIGAWFVAVAIHRGYVSKQNEDLRIKLYEKRYDIFLAFKDFIKECCIADSPSDKAFDKFSKGTERIDFLFGKEIVLYHREVIANAVAIIGITTNAPYVFPPAVGSLVGYFPGSTLITDLKELRSWFHAQRLEHLELYFKPYLDFSKAGVSLGEIKMKPPVLPKPPLVVRKEK